MAGNYPDVPSWRMAYDVDGTQAFHTTTQSFLSQLSSAQIASINNENPNSYFSMGSQGDNTRRLYVIFPELRDLDAYYLGHSGRYKELTSIAVSSDTTNGFDGTWTTIMGPMDAYPDKPIIPGSRSDISSFTALGIKAIRLSTSFRGNLGPSFDVTSFQLFGEPVPNENLQRLEIWHPTLDQRLGPADLDWGDVPRNSEEVREFRVKNMHPTLTANDVRVAMSILTDTTPSVVGQQAISQDGGVTWGAQQTLPNPLGPEAISPVFKLRRQTPSNATLSLWWYRLFADALVWT